MARYDERPQVADAPVVDRHDHRHRDQAEPDREALTLDVVETRLAVQGEAVARRVVDHQQPERADRDRQR